MLSRQNQAIFLRKYLLLIKKLWTPNFKGLKDRTLTLQQKHCVKGVLERVGISKSRPIKAPLEINFKLSSN